MNNTRVFSINEITQIIGNLINRIPLNNFLCKGEIVSFKIARKYIYIDLCDIDTSSATDSRAQIKVMYFLSSELEKERLENSLKIGDHILITANFNFYAHYSSITLIARKIEKLEDTVSLAMKIKKALIEKLDKEGYLEPSRKKKIPENVEKLAILTSKDSAAYNDLLVSLSLRLPCEITVYDTVMQGKDCVKSVVNNLDLAYQKDFDCIIISRGGGSKNDLEEFDSEEIAYKIAESKIPVITALGHSIDRTIADYVSDYCAITPTEAGSLINKSLESCASDLETYKYKLVQSELNILKIHGNSLLNFENQLNRNSPITKLNSKIYDYDSQLNRRMNSLINDNIIKFNTYSKSLETTRNYFNQVINNFNHLYKTFEIYNPTIPFSKGFTLIYKNNKIVRSIKDVNKDDDIAIKLIDGSITAQVKEIKDEK